ncbi:DUF6518 family protein [Actinoplanes sp. NPDC049596]|uniref:DUF6518 family protein n=1 Tax=unclassified Actinoplanes TaxID=2626549 RepID=UPI003432D238
MPVPARSLGKSLAIASAAGLVVGVLTLGGQALPGYVFRHITESSAVKAVTDVVAQLSNSGATWSAIAFLIVAALSLTRWAAALGGFLTLAGATVGYYAAATIFLHDDLSSTALRGPLIWAAIAVVAGPLFGLAAAIWRHGPTRLRPWALATPSALFIAEGLYNAIILHYWTESAVAVIIGLLLVIGLARTSTERRAALIRLLPTLAAIGSAFAAAVLITDAAFRA